MNNVFDKLVDAWISEHNNYRTEQVPSIGWGYRELNRLVQQEPFAALRVIDSIVRKDNSDPIMEVLAAGPLENILVLHGSIILSELTKFARENASFRDLLGGVWGDAVAPEVWREVEKLRTELW